MLSGDAPPPASGDRHLSTDAVSLLTSDVRQPLVLLSWRRMERETMLQFFDNGILQMLVELGKS
jgi:hypothetical protein